MPLSLPSDGFDTREEEMLYVTLNMIDHALRTFYTCLNRQIRGTDIVRLFHQCQRTHDNMKTFLSFVLGEHPRVLQYINTVDHFLVDQEELLNKAVKKEILDPKSIFQVPHIEQKIKILQHLHREIQTTQKSSSIPEGPPFCF
jgi:hypothetical protein